MPALDGCGGADVARGEESPGVPHVEPGGDAKAGREREIERVADCDDDGADAHAVRFSESQECRGAFRFYFKNGDAAALVGDEPPGGKPLAALHGEDFLALAADGVAGDEDAVWLDVKSRAGDGAEGVFGFDADDGVSRTGEDSLHFVGDRFEDGRLSGKRTERQREQDARSGFE